MPKYNSALLAGALFGCGGYCSEEREKKEEEMGDGSHYSGLLKKTSITWGVQCGTTKKFGANGYGAYLALARRALAPTTV
jgi:hypothetical protein